MSIFEKKQFDMVGGVIKVEPVGYLKSSMNLMQGTLYLTPDRVILEAHKTGVSGGGLLGFLLKKKVESKTEGFDMAISEIAKITEGKHGMAKGILEITDVHGKTFRIMVKNFEEWNTALSKKK